MAAKVVKYKASKKAYVGHVTRTLNSMDEELSKDEIDVDKLQQSVEKLELQYSKVDELSNKIQEESEDIEDIETEVDSMNTLLDKVIQIKSRAKAVVKKEVKIEEVRSPQRDVHGERSERKESIHLPKLAIPKFSGDIEKFREFMDMFIVTIHKNKRLEDVEKFMYLKSYLEGDAEELLEGLPRTDANYAFAMMLLEENYGNKEVLINNHVSKLINLEKQDEKDSSTLRVLYNKVTTHVRELEALEITAGMYSVFLVPIVSSKLTEDLLKMWLKRKQKGIDQLLKFIHEEVESSEEASYVEQAFKNNDSKIQKGNIAQKSSYQPKNSYTPKSSTSQYLPSSHALSSQISKKSCIFCQKNDDHYADECDKAKKMSPEEVRSIVKREEACLCCMKKGHRIVNCRQLRWLKCNTCGARNHNTLLHDDRGGKSEKKANGMVTSCKSQATSKVENPSILPQGIGRIAGPKGEIEINIMLDICSDKNFISSYVSEKIGLQGHTEEFSIDGITGKTDEAKPRRIVTATIKNRHHLEKFQTVKMVEVEEICKPFTRAAVSEKVINSKYLRHLQLADDYRKEKHSVIGVLIGLPSYWAMVSGRIRRSNNNPVAMESMLGWVLADGSSDEKNQSCTSVLSMFISTQEAQGINNQLKRFWEVENIEEAKSQVPGWTQEEQEVYTKFKETIKYEDETYEVSLPTKDDSEISSNKVVASRRFSSLKCRMKKNAELSKKYHEAMNEYIDAGYAEKVQEVKEPPGCYYCPHHAVIKEDRVSTKVRLVFDGSSNEGTERSLNDVLYKGPALQPKLTSIIMRFRQPKIAINADVKKMYLNISVKEDDRDKLRFFWKDGDNQQTVIYRSTVLPFGLTCSPFLAIATVHCHLDKYAEKYPNMVNQLKKNMYIDDALTGAETEDEAIQLYEESYGVMKKAGMELVKWNSNSPKLIKRCKEDGVASSVTEKNIDEDCSSKLLGVYWNSATDSFHFKGEEIINITASARATKRNILKIAPKLYDPMGWLSPFVVRVKILFQSLWERGLEWDENLPADVEKKWRSWVQELQGIISIEIPRRYDQSNSHIKRRELHVFGDASQEAYGSVAYLKSYDDEEETSFISLVYAKSKVAPVKKITLPRLELLAAEMSANMAQYVIEALEFSSVELYLWTDSKVSLHWIKGNRKQWKTFVYNRVQNTLKKSDPVNWRWCPGISNPADLVSRGMKVEDLKNSEFWWNGPSWLKQSPDEYPNEVLEEEHPLEVVAEKKEKRSLCMLQKSHKPDAQDLAGKLVHPTNYSRLKNLLKTTAYITRYIYNISHKAGERKSEPLTSEDMEGAEKYWIKEVQAENFPDEVASLKEGGLVKNSSKLRELSPYYNKEDGFIKMKGRIQYSDLSEDEKHPIILPAKSYVVKLIIEEVHRKQLHAGINQTLVSLRDHYWVITGRAVVRRVVKSCILCRKYAPVRLQVPMAPLPRDRITRSLPFEVVGVDFTGPVYIVNPGGKVIKGYIALFTCATIRAVHLELVLDLTTDAFLRAFRRFVSRRGMCSTIYSDNAKTFKKASRLLKEYQEIMKGRKFREFLLDHKIQWKFIVERAPWWGGFYERLMTTIKQPLKKILGRSSLTIDEMSTVLTEVEAMVNSRPLTFISDDPDEASYLTPSSFLIGRPTTCLPVRPCKGKEPTTKLTRKELNKMAVNQNKHLNQCWKMWNEEYVRNLGTVPTRQQESNKLKVGELVMVTDNMNPRCKWTVGIVDKVQEGRDAKIRRCWIKTGNVTKTRPVQHVSRLEMDSMEDFKEYSV